MSKLSTIALSNIALSNVAIAAITFAPAAAVTWAHALTITRGGRGDGPHGRH